MSEIDYTKIPIQNIYYLLSYAWDKLEDAKPQEVSETDCKNLTSLLKLTDFMPRGVFPDGERLFYHGKF